MELTDAEKENIKKSVKKSGENDEPISVDQRGSQEFYQRERVIEDIALPGERRSIKADPVRKEEIYQDKIEKQAAFIASLGSKKTEEEKTGNGQPEYVEAKSSRGKKIFFAILMIVVLGGLAGGGYRFWFGQQKEAVSEEAKNPVVIPVNQESPQAAADAGQTVEEAEKSALIDPTKLTVKVLNSGAAAGSAGKIKTLLIGKGYAKSEAGNGDLDSTGNIVYYSGQALSQDAEAVKKILSEGGTEAKILAALISEQKSADIVVILGK